MKTRPTLSVLLGVLAATAAVAVPASPAAGLATGRFSIDIGGSELVFAAGVIRPAGSGAAAQVVLEDGTGTGELLSWALTGARQDATIVLYDTGGKPVARYHLENAWPSKIEVGALRAGAPGVAYRTVTLSAAALRSVG